MKNSIDGREFNYEFPDRCPVCHRHVEPKPIATPNVAAGRGLDALQLLFRCPSSECQSAFIATYTPELAAPPHLRMYKLSSLAPWTARAPTVPAEIAVISPLYKVLLTQSDAAEARGLDQVAGAGYRKALEFLVKDYVLVDPAVAERADEIKAQFLGNAIDTYIPDHKVKACAKRAAWLGNDESHYVRKWEDKDVRDLKAPIKLTETWMLNTIQTKRYLDEMN